MSDIKKFVGYTAGDGTTHKTLKEAQQHTLAVKTTAALHAAFPAGFVQLPDGTQDDGSKRMDIADFLLENKAAILAAFDQTVRLRAPRKPKAKPAAADQAAPTA